MAQHPCSNPRCDNDSARYFVTEDSYDSDKVNIECHDCRTMAAVTREDFIDKFGYSAFERLCEDSSVSPSRY